MKRIRVYAQTIVGAFWLLLVSFCVAGEQPPRIGELSFTDRQYMAQQRASLDDLARAKLGSQISGNKDRDLALLQTLLDRNLISADQTKELQSMGVIMGDLLAKELDMQWVIYEDVIGRSRALRYKDTDNYLFPMTMISRRREAGNLSTVSHIYQRALDLVKPHLPALPFQ